MPILYYLCTVVYYKTGDIELDSATHTVSRNGQPVGLTPLEFALLEYLLRHPDRLCTREEILDKVWGQRFLYDTGTIDVHLTALRRKLGFTRHHPITTVRGAGLILHTDAPARRYSLTLLPFITEWLQSHSGEFEAKGLVPRMNLDPFVSEITMSPDTLRTMLDGILAALLPAAGPGTIHIVSRLGMTHFSLLLDLNGTINELRIPLVK